MLVASKCLKNTIFIATLREISNVQETGGVRTVLIWDLAVSLTWGSSEMHFEPNGTDPAN